MATPAGADSMIAKVTNLQDLRGQFIKNQRDGTVYQIEAVGRMGVTAYEIGPDGQPIKGVENVITWRAMQKLYTILVSTEDLNIEKVRK